MIGLMVDWPIVRGNWYMRNNWTRMCIVKSPWLLPPLQSTIFVDDTFDYSGQILEKIPLLLMEPSQESPVSFVRGADRSD